MCLLYVMRKIGKRYLTTGGSQEIVYADDMLEEEGERNNWA